MHAAMFKLTTVYTQRAASTQEALRQRGCHGEESPTHHWIDIINNQGGNDHE
jgi:hypothetical protein